MRLFTYSVRDTYANIFFFQWFSVILRCNKRETCVICQLIVSGKSSTNAIAATFSQTITDIPRTFRALSRPQQKTLTSSKQDFQMHYFGWITSNEKHNFIDICWRLSKWYKSAMDQVTKQVWGTWLLWPDMLVWPIWPWNLADDLEKQ